MSRLRVLFPFAANTFGGSHVSSLLLMREIREFGFDPVAMVHGNGLIERRLTEAGIEQHRVVFPHFRSGQSLLSYLPTMARLLPVTVRAIRQSEAVIIHVNDSRMANTWIPGARMAGCGIVLHQRTRFSPSRLLEWNAGHADAVVAISEYVRSTLNSTLRAHTDVVFNPFEDLPAPSRSLAKERVLGDLNMDVDGPVVGFVGTLSEQKRPEMFLQAAAMVRTLPSPIFLMFGRADESDVARISQRAAALGLAGRFRVVGFSENMAMAMAACDVIVAPAINEGFGRVPIEAALAGTPTVAAASGGHLESIVDGRTGLLVRPDDPAAFAAGVDALLSDTERASAMVSAARKRVRDSLSPRRHAEAIAAIYRRLQ